MKIGKNIKKLRVKNNLTQEQLAGVLYVSRQAIAKWENDRSYPDQAHLISIAEYFKITLDELVKGYDLNEVKLDFKWVYSLLGLLTILIVGSIILNISLSKPIIDVILIPGLILMCIFPVAGLFVYAIKTEDFSMIAGYKPTKDYNLNVLKKMLFTMLVVYIVISISTVTLHGIRFLVNVPDNFNILILGNFIFLFTVFTLVIQFRNKSNLYH